MFCLIFWGCLFCGKGGGVDFFREIQRERTYISWQGRAVLLTCNLDCDSKLCILDSPWKDLLDTRAQDLPVTWVVKGKGTDSKWALELARSRK